MYIEVCFKRKNGEYGGKTFTYNCAIPVKSGDIVMAPTFKGDTPAMVMGIGIPYEEINPEWRDNLRTITEKCDIHMTPEEEEGMSLFDEVKA